MLVYRPCLYVFAASLVLAYGQVPEEASLSLLVQIVDLSGPLNGQTRDTFLKSSGLSGEQLHIVSDALSLVLISNLEQSAARIRNRPGADFTGWAKFHSLLQSIEQQMKVHRGICNNNSVVYTFGTLLRGNSSMTGIAVADGFYPAGQGHLYAEANLRSPGGREITARSPAGSNRIHAAAIVALQIQDEDGTYQSSYNFGELCGEDKVPRIYSDHQN
ncbi:MAG: hypothetical protein DMG57_22555 [Acidobacteria bacterium]|nr:MAG: hypothetical protein DMG57_22555 [Acidobacteriota bacterium]